MRVAPAGDPKVVPRARAEPSGAQPFVCGGPAARPRPGCHGRVQDRPIALQRLAEDTRLSSRPLPADKSCAESELVGRTALSRPTVRL
jgi:hypothetical protein